MKGRTRTLIFLVLCLLASFLGLTPSTSQEVRQLIPVREVGIAQERQRPRAGGKQTSAVAPTHPPQEGEEPHLQPVDMVRWALVDVRNLPADVHPHQVRYLASYNHPPYARPGIWKDGSFAINSLSRNRMLALPPVIPNTEGSLFRIDLTDYGIDPKEWDRLVELGSGRSPYPEPYFHQYTLREVHEEKAPPFKWIQVQKEEPPGTKWINQDGSPLMVWKKVPAPATAHPITPGQRTYEPAEWIGWGTDRNRDIQDLIGITGTEHPVVRADWFCTYALWAPRYYDLLGLGGKANIDDFRKFLRARVGSDADRKVAGIVVTPPRQAKVALNNRLVLFVPSTNYVLGSYYWETRDSRRSTNKRQYLNIVLDVIKIERGLRQSAATDKQFFDATEDIGLLANGLQAYFLTDGVGNRLDKADSDIATDKTSTYQDTQVWSARNCISCHLEGIRPVREAIRDFAHDQIGLLVVNDDVHRTNEKLVRDFFGYDIQAIIKANQAIYASGVLAATRGRTAAENATAFMDLTATYLDQGVGLRQIAWDVGIPEEKLAGYLRRGIGLDPTLTGLIKDPPEDIRRDQYENNSFPQLMQFLKTYREEP
jgi:hypothetical protein